jgi:phage-related protein
LLHAVVKRSTSLAERDIRLAERRLHTWQSRQAIQEE